MHVQSCEIPASALHAPQVLHLDEEGGGRCLQHSPHRDDADQQASLHTKLTPVDTSILYNAAPAWDCQHMTSQLRLSLPQHLQPASYVGHCLCCLLVIASGRVCAVCWWLLQDIVCAVWWWLLQDIGCVVCWRLCQDIVHTFTYNSSVVADSVVIIFQLSQPVVHHFNLLFIISTCCASSQPLVVHRCCQRRTKVSMRGWQTCFLKTIIDSGWEITWSQLNFRVYLT